MSKVKVMVEVVPFPGKVIVVDGVVVRFPELFFGVMLQVVPPSPTLCRLNV